MSRIVTLTTDFGGADGYVGAMKGRILTLAPETALVDISHEIAAQDIVQGAWCLRRAARQFPPGTVHLAVVDPGVGSERRGIVLETEHYLLIGPDNGVLAWVAEADGTRAAYVIDPARGPWRRDATFEGLSLFAPVAGYLAAGGAPDAVGPRIPDWTRLALNGPTACQNCIEGEVILHDRFGNAITNITQASLTAFTGRPLARIEAGGREALACARYADLEGLAGALGALWNSDGHLELFTYRGSAREAARLARGAPVRAFPATP